ncbi:MAG: hypothetical protein AVDCRST_MAG40-647 [uncultured Gemmatimonadaceae bacterium]|uniref:DUF883 domain-containing protein n=1 Tax=uncultured Gemmatimonadaceae bacterium TaxID=246130 RepID=A0A6J4KH53_9BACT|nr:MAG: hypothetical protein AVDCRST_MAG40-647 [uncultured Gemmatimonadaceae bacterium]
MERNDDLTNTTGSLGNSSTSPNFGSAGSVGSGSGMSAGASDVGSGMGSGMGSGAGSSGSSAGRAQSAKDAATEKLGQAREVAADKFGQAKTAVSSGLSTAKDKASTLNASLADKLEAGANKLRQNATASGSPYAPSVGIDGAAALSSSGTSSDQMGQLGTRAADALQGTANFLREGDVKASIEQQVRTNPARTLLVALGVGYVLGKALRSNR